MKAQLLKYWDLIWSSFWFLPTLMLLASGGAAAVTITIDRAVPKLASSHSGWAYSGSAEGASAVLETIAGSMVTIAGVVFSLTLVALSLASQQFGPRLLRTFMRDSVNQMVLGTFVSTFLYCLLVLRTIRRSETSEFVPNLSVSVGVLLALTSFGVLIYFIHHVSTSIQADWLIARVHVDLLSAIERLPERSAPVAIPESSSHATETDNNRELHENTGAVVPARLDGYVQFVDVDSLQAAAEKHDLMLELLARPGNYVVCRGALVRVWPKRALEEGLADQLHGAFAIGSQRTSAQDLEFSMMELVEIAVRALSPGVNDPFTAMTCLDRLGSGLCRLAERSLCPLRICDPTGRVRVIGPGTTFAGAADLAFHQIRQNARGNPAVTLRLLETVTQVARCTRHADVREELARHAEIILRGARQTIQEPADLKDVAERYADCVAALGRTAPVSNRVQQAPVFQPAGEGNGESPGGT